MDALVQPIERVVEAGEWFVRTPSLRVLHIVTSGLLRTPVLSHLCASELLEANTCPFFVLEGPTEPGDDGWTLRAEELRLDWEGLAKSAPDDVFVEPLWAPQHARTPLTRFGLELGRALASVRAPMTGLVIVLAPVWVRDPEVWRRDLEILLAERGLAGARFVIVELEEPHALPVVRKLGGAAEHLDLRVDEAALRDEANARLDAMKNAPPGATGPQLVGAAGPRVTPPRRKRDPAPLTPEQREETARQIGIAPAMLDPDVMQSLRVLVLSAAAAMGEKNAPEAVRLQREARDLCMQHGLAREAVVNELVLAGYVLQGGSPARALELFRDARGRAEAAQLADFAVQAQMAVGSCLLVLKQVDEAAAAYAQAGQLGANAGAPILAIEAYRMCGQLLASRGKLQEASTAFRRALDTAEDGGEAVKTGSTAMEAARELAALCRKHGLTQQAASLEAQAAAIEASIHAGEGSAPPS